MLDTHTRSELSFAMESYMGALNNLQEIANSHIRDVTLGNVVISIMRNEIMKLADTLDHLHDIAVNDLEDFGQAHDLNDAVDQTEAILAALRRSITTGVMTAGSLSAYLDDLEEAFTTIFTPYLMNGALYV